MFSDFVSPEYVILNLESTEKDELFAEMVETVVRNKDGIDRRLIFDALEERESMMNTCIMKGVAMPHGMVSSLDGTTVVVGISRAGIDYGDVPDVFQNEPVKLVIMILYGAVGTEQRLELLSECAKLLRQDDFCNAILKAVSSEDICSVFRQFNEEL